jgi:hypothetical protein
MPKSLISELPKIVEEGRKEAQRMLERLNCGVQIILQIKNNYSEHKITISSLAYKHITVLNIETLSKYLMSKNSQQKC